MSNLWVLPTWPRKSGRPSVHTSFPLQAEPSSGPPFPSPGGPYHLPLLGQHPLALQPLSLGTQPPVPHLARGLHPLEDTEKHDDPGQQQAEAEVPADLAGSADALAALNVQDVAAV